ncbi:MAG: hypothetical protein JWM41_2237 [Gemmatimonadetes bacterium]|nr:hypothetical protein [Gemmatimonadota bacterium]
MPGSIRGAGLLALVLSVACHHRGKPTATAVGPDSAQGVVSIVGTGFDQQLVLQGAAATRPTRLRITTEADSAALTRLGGVEVLVRGTRADDGFRVSTFTAVRVGASPVVDGVLRLDGDHVVLETSTGRTTLGNPPDALRRMIGARVWISGPLATGPNSYGIIVPAR